MPIFAIGLNHTTAPLHLREQLSFRDENIRATFIRSLRQSQCPVREAIILSTCNRTELYAVSEQTGFDGLENFLAQAAYVPASQFALHLYRYQGVDAVEHLFRVAAGLDSLVLGESQILGQVTRALKLAQQLESVGPLLSRLFQAAIHAGKRVHTETAIDQNPASVASLAASIVQRSVTDVATARIAILGAGEMAQLTAESLHKRGANHLLMINRTLERAQTVAERWGAGAAPLTMLEESLGECDALVSAISTDHPFITAEMIGRVMSQRQHYPLTLIDIAVPRSIDASVANIENVSLYDIDHLNGRLEQSLAQRQAEVPHAEAILAEEQAAFLHYMSLLGMMPVIADLHQKAEQIRQAELAKTLRHLPNLSADEREHVEAMSRALVSKLLAAPTKRLRQEANSANGPEYAEMARALFGL